MTLVKSKREQLYLVMQLRSSYADVTVTDVYRYDKMTGLFMTLKPRFAIQWETQSLTKLSSPKSNNVYLFSIDCHWFFINSQINNYAKIMFLGVSLLTTIGMTCHSHVIDNHMEDLYTEENWIAITKSSVGLVWLACQVQQFSDGLAATNMWHGAIA